jgi:hypothetical protein
MGAAGKPKFNDVLEKGTLVGAPPFEFQKVVLRNFPLNANFRTLTRFCDKYLNIADRFVHFRPAMPFVVLSIVNYGKMSREAGNLGWTSQNELLFAVPIEWYERDEHGQLSFKGFAQVSPFIFVDDEDSQVVGREVYGWPKVQGWFSPGLDPWVRHPLNRPGLLSLSASVFEEMFSGQVPRPRELLSIEAEAPPAFSVVPPQLDNILNPWVSIPKAITGWGGLVATVAEMLTAPAFRGYNALDREARPELLDSSADVLEVFTRTLLANTINLKQMRDAANPEEFCYQALTNASMEISQIRRGGFLGDLALLRGDPTGGFRIRLHEYANQPIVETLGLEVAGRVAGAIPTVTLNPVMPFWQELDLTYRAGENICWRTKRGSQTSKWQNHAGERPCHPDPDPDAAGSLYNTLGSNGFGVATGPFSFPGATLRVLPLPADGTKLALFVEEHLNDPIRLLAKTNARDPRYRFEAWGDYVYMVVTAYGDMVSETADIGNWAHRQVDFAVPVRWFDHENKLLSCGFVSPFTFMDSDIGATTAREVNGFAARKAEIATAESSWLSEQGPFADVRPLMDVKTKILAALNLDQRSEMRTIIEVVDGNLIAGMAAGQARRRWDDHLPWKYVAETWGRPLQAELKRMADMEPSKEFKALRALSVEILGNRQPINQVSLKQFRDAEEVERACYQALVRTELVIERIWDIRELEDQTHVKIHRFPTLPIVETLGLRVQSRMLTDEGEVECLQPIRPFYMKVGLKSGPSDVIWSWPDEKPETAHPRWYFQRPPTDQTDVGPWLVDGLDRLANRPVLCMADCQTEATKLPSQEGGSAAGAFERRKLFLAEAGSAVCCKELQPQMVVHAMLSNNWENRGFARGTKFNRTPKLPTFVVRRDSVGLGDESEGAACELFPVTQDQDKYPRVNFEFPYWSPWPRSEPKGQPTKEELEAYANITDGLEWALVPEGSAKAWKLVREPGGVWALKLAALVPEGSATSWELVRKPEGGWELKPAKPDGEK